MKKRYIRPEVEFEWIEPEDMLVYSKCKTGHWYEGGVCKYCSQDIASEVFEGYDENGNQTIDRDDF